MNVIVFDIDGVLADNSNYNKWYKNGEFIPEKFGKDIPKLKVNMWAKELVNLLYMTNYVILLTARRKSFREKTEAWLSKYDIHYDMLITNDETKDQVEYKLEKLTKIPSVSLIVEDNPELVKAMRKEGYVVLQPNNMYED